MKTFEEIKKFNPYHGSDGRFTTGAAATSFTIRTKNPAKQGLADKAVEREKERTKKMGASGGSISKIKSYDELDKAAKTIGFKGGITQALRDKVDIQVASRYLQGVSAVADEFPEIKDRFNQFSEANSGVASTNGSSVFLNSKHMGKIENAEKIVKTSTESKYWPQNSSIESVGAHEAGHCIENALAARCCNRAFE